MNKFIHKTLLLIFCFASLSNFGNLKAAEEIGEWKLKKTLRNPIPFTFITLQTNSLFLATSHGTIETWNWYSNRKEHKFNHGEHITATNISIDGRLLASAGEKNINILDLETSEVIRTFKCKNYGRDWFVSSIAISPDTKFLAVAENNQTYGLGNTLGRIIIWNLRTGKQEKELQSNATFVAFKSEKTLISTSYHDGQTTINIWNVQNNDFKNVKPSRCMSSHHAFSSDYKYFAQVGVIPNKLITEIWDLDTQNRITMTTEEYNDVRSIEFYPKNHNILLLGMPDGTINFFDCNTKNQLKTLKCGNEPINQIKFHPTNPNILAIGSENTIQIWEREESSLWKKAKEAVEDIVEMAWPAKK